MSTVYFIAAVDHNLYDSWEDELSSTGTINVKIGGTDDKLSKRFGNLQTGNDRSLELVHRVLTLPDFRKLEDYYKKKYSSRLIQGEWFKLTAKDIRRIRLDDHCAELILAEHHRINTLEKEVAELKKMIQQMTPKLEESTININDDSQESDDTDYNGTDNETLEGAINNFISVLKEQKPVWYKEHTWIHLDKLREQFDSISNMRFKDYGTLKFNKLVKKHVGKYSGYKLLDGLNRMAVFLKKYSEL